MSPSGKDTWVLWVLIHQNPWIRGVTYARRAGSYTGPRSCRLMCWEIIWWTRYTWPCQTQSYLVRGIPVGSTGFSLNKESPIVITCALKSHSEGSNGVNLISTQKVLKRPGKVGRACPRRRVVITQIERRVVISIITKVKHEVLFRRIDCERKSKFQLCLKTKVCFYVKNSKKGKASHRD